MAALRLSRSQLAAGAADLERVYVEAGPGSGKTVVATLRFGAMRFSRLRDRRGVAALSFTRSATAELRRRILRRWGPISVSSPNRVSTIDALLADLLRYALAEQAILWPNRHVELQVRDDWSMEQRVSLSDRVLELSVLQRKVLIREVRLKEAVRHIAADAYREMISSGHCTHEDIRSVVRGLLDDSALRLKIGGWLASNYKGIIIDEVFDANPLDLDLISLAGEHGILISLIGDPWQALYEFRGARPDLVPARLASMDFVQVTLPDSFRFSGRQKILAQQARAGLSIVLEQGDAGAVDVVLCSKWSMLLDARRGILPLALGGTKSVPWAIATLVLDSVTSSTVGVSAIDVSTALQRLGISDDLSVAAIRLLHESVLRCLRQGSAADSGNAAWACVVDWVATNNGFVGKHRRRKQQVLVLRQLLLQVATPTVGLTIHQAKGLEWNRVGLLLRDDEQDALTRGLSNVSAAERMIYVALTRARFATVLV